MKRVTMHATAAWGVVGALALLMISCGTPREFQATQLSSASQGVDPDKPSEPGGMVAGMGIVVGVQGGKAFWMEGESEWRSVRPGTKFKAGAAVRTQAGTKVNMRLGRTVLRVCEDSVLVIDRCGVDEGPAEPVVDARMTLVQGSILGNVPGRQRTSRHEITTLAGLISVKGGQYFACYCGEFRLVSGTGSITTSGGTLNLNAGDYFNPTTGKIEGPPRGTFPPAVLERRQ